MLLSYHVHKNETFVQVSRVDQLVGLVNVTDGGVISIVKVIPVLLFPESVRTNIFTQSEDITDQLVYDIPLSVAPEI